MVQKGVEAGRKRDRGRGVSGDTVKLNFTYIGDFCLLR